MTEIRIVGAGDAGVLDTVAPGVFDGPVHPRWWTEFLADSRHHLAVAIADGRVVGMASGVHYVHPDKPPELFVNEVGVCRSHRNLGLATRLVQALLAHGRALGCVQGWVLANPANTAACRTYERAGGVPFAESIVMYEFRLE